MSDDNQIHVPPSFMAVYSDPRQRLREPADVVRSRYEFCEDLACHLVEQAQTIYHSGNASEEGVLLGFYAAISGEASAVSPREAGWIIQRLAELLEWKAPKLPEAPEQA